MSRKLRDPGRFTGMKLKNTDHMMLEAVADFDEELMENILKVKR